MKKKNNSVLFTRLFFLVVGVADCDKMAVCTGLQHHQIVKQTWGIRNAKVMTIMQVSAYLPTKGIEIRLTLYGEGCLL